MGVNRAHQADPGAKSPEVRRERGAPFLPWSGAIGAALGSLVQHQGLGNSLRFDCTIDAPLWGIVTGLVALLLIGTGALLSARVFRAHAGQSTEDSTHRFIAGLSLMAAALAAGFVVLMTLAALIVPPCPP